MARRVVSALQKVPATYIYGDDYGFKSVWDEYCHEVQNGPSLGLEWAWDETIGPYISHQIGLLPAHARLPISIGAEYERADFDNMFACYNPGLIHDSTRDNLDKMAAARKMDRFSLY